MCDVLVAMPSVTRNRFAGREHLDALSAPWGSGSGSSSADRLSFAFRKTDVLMKDGISDLAAALIDLRGKLRG